MTKEQIRQVQTLFDNISQMFRGVDSDVVGWPRQDLEDVALGSPAGTRK